MTDIQVYKETLLRLGESIPYVVIGTFALLNLPEKVVLSSPPGDLDIIIPKNEDILNKAINILEVESYELYSWKDKVDENFDNNLFEGRFYVRGIKKINERCFIIDITYESDIVNFDELYEKSNLVESIRIAAIEDIITLLEARGSDKDKKLISKINSLVRGA
ncbi:MAG: hypothetical protein E6772_02535 [Dysgonomonas sp.]|nr:hypothetical protein [Dysgonomonas sp.]